MTPVGVSLVLPRVLASGVIPPPSPMQLGFSCSTLQRGERRRWLLRSCSPSCVSFRVALSTRLHCWVKDRSLFHTPILQSRSLLGQPVPHDPCSLRAFPRWLDRCNDGSVTRSTAYLQGPRCLLRLTTHSSLASGCHAVGFGGCPGFLPASRDALPERRSPIYEGECCSLFTSGVGTWPKPHPTTDYKLSRSDSA
jgi:hypothetical protein